MANHKDPTWLTARLSEESIKGIISPTTERILPARPDAGRPLNICATLILSASSNITGTNRSEIESSAANSAILRPTLPLIFESMRTLSPISEGQVVTVRSVAARIISASLTEKIPAMLKAL